MRPPRCTRPDRRGRGGAGRGGLQGPAKTPYEDALFAFDVWLGTDYPAAPPQASGPAAAEVGGWGGVGGYI